MIYLDLLILLNMFYDYLLIWTVGLTLKRKISYLRIFASSVVGAFTSLIVVLELNYFIILLYKVIIGYVMLYIAYGNKSLKYVISNLIYLYMSSIILAGFLYYLESSTNISYIILLILSPIILIVYIYLTKKLKEKQNLYYDVKVMFKNNKELLLGGFIDSGNRLKDPITNKYIIIVNKKIYNNKDPIYVPFKGVNKTGLLRCFSLKYIEVNNKRYSNYLLGVSDENINLEGVDCLLNYKLMEEINV